MGGRGHVGQEGKEQEGAQCMPECPVLVPCLLMPSTLGPAITVSVQAALPGPQAALGSSLGPPCLCPPS